MKISGILLFLLSTWLLYAAWYDPVEGKIARPLAFLGLVAGVVIFSLGIRNDIIAATKRRDNQLTR